MRMNIYAEELTDEWEVVEKVVEDEEFGRRTFYGVRLYLKSPPELHHSDDDDDRSGITFWVRSTKAGEGDLSLLTAISLGLDTALDDISQRMMKAGVEARG